jgi:hypothetical protein
MDHVAEWKAHVHLYEHDDATQARVTLETDANTLISEGLARRHPADPQVPEIGDELAVGRALIETRRAAGPRGGRGHRRARTRPLTAAEPSVLVIGHMVPFGPGRADRWSYCLRVFRTCWARTRDPRLSGMTAIPWHRSQSELKATKATFDFPFDDLLLAEQPTLRTNRADCCTAAAAYRVVLPVTPTRDRPAELLLCGHHLRDHARELRDKCAAIFDAENRLVMTAAAS